MSAINTIDHHAWTNHWRHWHPAEKILPAISLLILTLVRPPLTSSPMILLSMLLATCAAGIPLRAVLQVLAAPTAFLLAGAPFLALSLDFTDGLQVQMAPNGWLLACETTVRAMAAVSCLGFIALTTPLVDGLAWLQRAGVPASLTDLIFLMYRLIFVFAERAITGHHAQTARLGYARFGRGIHSFGLLTGNLLQRALDHAQRLERGLAARGYDGQLHVLTTEQPLSWRRLTVGLIGVVLIGCVG